MRPATTYDERLWPPGWLWVVGWLLVGLLAVSVHAALGPVWGLLALLAPGALMTWGLISSAARIRVADGELVAGPARIPLEHLGQRAVAGPGARRVRCAVPSPTRPATT